MTPERSDTSRSRWISRPRLTAVPSTKVVTPYSFSFLSWPAAISIGTKPTFNEDGDAERVVEAYAITDDWLDLYGHQARVEFAGFLRPQIKFDSADDLVVELKRNVEETKRLTA